MDNGIKNKLSTLIGQSRVVIVCIGTDLLSGDCIGPLIGQMLIENKVPCFVYGTLNSPVTALNVDRVNEFIKARHKGQLVVAIDSAVGGSVGRVRVYRGALQPGSASNKVLLPIGDVAITITTTKSLPYEEGFSLVPLGFLYLTAKKVADELAYIIKSNPLYNENGQIASII